MLRYKGSSSQGFRFTSVPSSTGEHILGSGAVQEFKRQRLIHYDQEFKYYCINVYVNHHIGSYK